MIKDRYWSTVQVKSRGEINLKEYEIFCDASTKPTVGDFIATFRAEGITTELQEFRPLTFRASQGDLALTLVVLRTLKDHTYKK